MKQRMYITCLNLWWYINPNKSPSILISLALFLDLLPNGTIFLHILQKVFHARLVENIKPLIFLFNDLHSLHLIFFDLERRLRVDHVILLVVSILKRVYPSNEFIIGEIDKAIKDYKNALQIEPNNAFCYYNLGISLDKKGFP